MLMHMHISHSQNTEHFITFFILLYSDLEYNITICIKIFKI